MKDYYSSCNIRGYENCLLKSAPYLPLLRERKIVMQREIQSCIENSRYRLVGLGTILQLTALN